MSEDFNMVAPKKVLIMTRVPLIIQLPGNQTQNSVWVENNAEIKHIYTKKAKVTAKVGFR